MLVDLPSQTCSLSLTPEPSSYLHCVCGASGAFPRDPGRCLAVSLQPVLAAGSGAAVSSFGELPLSPVPVHAPEKAAGL